jgi:hypothetical protein
VRVRDDGRGGADPTGGSGLVGLIDRVEALGGRLALDSPPGVGTTLHVLLPLTPPGEPELPTTTTGRAAGPSDSSEPAYTGPEGWSPGLLRSHGGRSWGREPFGTC